MYIKNSGMPGKQRHGNIRRGNSNGNGALDSITNLSNSNTGDMHTISTLAATNANFRKQCIDLNAKLVVELEKLETSGAVDLKNVTVGPVDQEATIHPKNAHSKKKNTKITQKNLKNGDIIVQICLERTQ